MGVLHTDECGTILSNQLRLEKFFNYSELAVTKQEYAHNVHAMRVLSLYTLPKSLGHCCMFLISYHFLSHLGALHIYILIIHNYIPLPPISQLLLQYSTTMM